MMVDNTTHFSMNDINANVYTYIYMMMYADLNYIHICHGSAGHPPTHGHGPPPCGVGGGAVGVCGAVLAVPDIRNVCSS